MRHRPRSRWFVVAVFFIFMLLHQSDRLLIGTLTTNIMATFRITMTQMGAVSTGALIVGAICYPLWGYLYDRYGRAKLLALASFIWGATTWLNAIAPTYKAFLFTRASTGIDDSSYPGIYSLISDLFGPKVRGKVYGLLQLTAPLGFLLGMILALSLRDVIGWRGVFYITGSLGVILAVVIYFGVPEPPRGGAEPEMAGLETVTTYKFKWPIVWGLFKKPTLLLIFVQGFFGVFPWNVITFWFFAYLETERGYTGVPLLVTMAYPARPGNRLDDRCAGRRRAAVFYIEGARGQPVVVPGDAVVYRSVHPLRLAQRGLHRVRHHPARGAQHGVVDREPHRVSRRGAFAADRRLHRGSLVSGHGDLADMRIDLAPVCAVLHRCGDRRAG
jgi:MFS family permease